MTAGQWPPPASHRPEVPGRRSESQTGCRWAGSALGTRRLTRTRDRRDGSAVSPRGCTVGGIDEPTNVDIHAGQRIHTQDIHPLSGRGPVHATVTYVQGNALASVGLPALTTRHFGPRRPLRRQRKPTECPLSLPLPQRYVDRLQVADTGATWVVRDAPVVQPPVLAGTRDGRGVRAGLSKHEHRHAGARSADQIGEVLTLVYPRVDADGDLREVRIAGTANAASLAA